MMPRIGYFAILLSLIISFEWYVVTGYSQIFQGSTLALYIYWIITLLTLVGFYKVYIDFRSNNSGVRSPFSNLLLGFGFAILIAKIVFIGLLLVQDLGRLLVGLSSGFLSLFTDINTVHPERSPLLTTASAILASIPFVSMLYGITRGKYKYEVENVQLNFQDLPSAFDGFKIVQLSDIHAGSFDSIEQVRKGVELAMRQQPDLIVFTGDLVNSLKEEIDPYISTFAALDAPYGMYSILGNHDYYGMYRVAQKDPFARKIYMDDFNKKHSDIGFTLLNNQSVKIEKEGKFINLIGVENWGKGPFPKKGDLNKALNNVEDDAFSILLSHDPTHWEHHALPHRKHIHLTLSGHTHGLQFGINIGRIKWSPVKYRYKRWMGLYEEAEQYLYVNRGFGFLAWPGRVGMSPEITVITLNKIGSE